MNLQALQYIDINKVIQEGLRTELGENNLSLLQRIDGSDSDRYVVVEGRRYKKTRQYQINCEGVRPQYMKAQPLFSNSILSTEISVALPVSTNMSLQEHPENLHIHSPSTYRSDALDVPVDTELYYGLQEPLPQYLGAQLYRRSAHLVLLLNNPSKLAAADTNLIYGLFKQICQPDLNNTSQANIVIPCFLEESSHQSGGRRISLSNKVKVDYCKLTHLYHRINIIGKSDLLLCDSSGIAVDAIRSSVPIAFINKVPKGFEDFQHAALRFLDHKCRHQLLLEQQAALEKKLRPSNSEIYVMSNQSTLRALIRGVSRRITGSCSKQNHELVSDTITHMGDALAQLRFQNQDKLILNTQHTMSKTPNAVKLKSRLTSGRRKYQKFRESPVRFMEDSQSSILRYLAANR